MGRWRSARVVANGESDGAVTIIFSATPVVDDDDGGMAGRSRRDTSGSVVLRTGRWRSGGGQCTTEKSDDG